MQASGILRANEQHQPGRTLTFDEIIQPFINTDWDRNFVSNNGFKQWLAGQVELVPITPGELLVNYVHGRLAAAGALAQPNPATDQSSQQAQQSQGLDQDADVEIEEQAEEDDDEDGDSSSSLEVVQSAADSNLPVSNDVKMEPAAQSTSISPQMLSVKQESKPDNHSASINPASLVSSQPAVSRKQAYQQSLAIPTQPLPQPSDFLRVRTASPQLKTEQQTELLERPARQASPALPPKPRTVPSTTPKAESSKPKQSLWQRSLPAIRTQLDPAQITRFSTRSAVKLVELLEIASSEDQPIPAEVRVEILTAMINAARASAAASRQYFEAWRDSSVGLEILENWFRDGQKAAFDAIKNKGAPKNALADTLLPCLKVWDLIPITVAVLQNRRIGKLVTSVGKYEAFDPSVAKVAKDIGTRWRKLVADEAAAKERRAERELELKRKADSAQAEEEARKKRKVSPPNATAKVTASTPSFLKNKGGTSSLKGLSIGKRAPTEAGTGAAGPSALNDEFAAALQMIQRGSLPTASAATPTNATSNIARPAAGKARKTRKTVTWKPDNQLCAIREIEKAIYDDDVNAPDSGVDKVKAMEHNEGAVLHRDRGNLDKFPWYEPKCVITGLTEEEERDRIYPTTQPLFPQFEQWSYAMENEWVANAMADVTYDSDNRFDQPDGPAEPTLDEVIDESVCKTIDPGQRLSDDGDFRLALESVRKPKVAADPTQLTALLSQLTGTLPASGPGSALRPPTSGILTNHLTSPFNAFTPTSSSNAMPLGNAGWQSHGWYR